MLTFKNVIDDFSTTMDALRDFVDSVGPVLTQKQEKTLNDAGKAVPRFRIALWLADENLENSDVEKVFKTVLMATRNILTGAAANVQSDKLLAFREAVRKAIPIRIVGNKVELDDDHPSAPELIGYHKMMEKLEKEIVLLRESSLMALASRSEWFVAQLIHLYFHMYPQAAGMSEPFFSLDALASLLTIDDARDALIDHKVESIMRLSFEDWLIFFKDKPKLGLSYLEADRSRLAEIFKRRNLIVHNGGRVSRKYLQEVDGSLCAGLKPGDSIEITPDYLRASIDLIEHQFILVAVELWKKLDAADQARGSSLTNLAVQCLKDRRWTTARGFSYFTINDKNLMESTRLQAQVNYWQSYKWAGEYEQIRGEVEKADFSAKSPLYRLAHAALMDDFEAVFKMLPSVLESGELAKNQLLNWPLFQTVRQQPNFEPYSTAEAELKPNEESAEASAAGT